MCRGFISCFFRILLFKNEFESYCPHWYGLFLRTGKKLNLISISLGLIVFILTNSILHFFFLYLTCNAEKSWIRFLVRTCALKSRTSECLVCSYYEVPYHRIVLFRFTEIKYCIYNFMFRIRVRCMIYWTSQAVSWSKSKRCLKLDWLTFQLTIHRVIDQIVPHLHHDWEKYVKHKWMFF